MLERSACVESPSLRAVFVAGTEVLANWAGRLPSSGVLTLTDADLPRALQVIADRHPPLVIVEQRLAASSRGAAMLACLRGNPALAGIEVQVLSAERSAAAAAPGAVFAGTPLTGTHLEVIDRAPVRRAPRLRVPDGLRAVVDGTPAAIVDFSMLGAQVLSPTILRPNQRVRVVLMDQTDPLRAAAGVAWSAFEKSPITSQPHFRVGLEFNQIDPQVKVLYDRLRQEKEEELRIGEEGES
jgi:PilZ domain-containing protein